MQKIFWTLLFLLLILSACSPGGLSPEALPSNPVTQVPPPPEMIATFAVPHIDQGPEGANTIPPPDPQQCGYQWAYQELPELSADFLEAIQRLQADAQARAFAFGEDCIRADKTATFIPMETDFNITLSVSDLSDESELGAWIVKVMQVIVNIPPAQIVGPRPGRVSLVFQSNGEQIDLSFYIDQYRALPAGLDTTQIYQALQIPG